MLLRVVLVAGLVVGSVVQVAGPAVADGGIVPGHSRYPSGGTATVGLGIDAAVNNAQLAETIPASIKLSWRAQPTLCPQAGQDDSFQAVTVGAVVVSFDKQYQCQFLSAYRISTGALLWRKQFHTGVGPAVAADGKNVYYLHDETMTAFVAATGRRLWERGNSESSLSVGSGLIASGTGIYSAATGKLLAQAHPRQWGGTSIVVGKTIYYQAPGSVEAWNLDGTTGWAQAGFGSNGPPSVHNGVVYAQSGVQNPAAGYHTVAFSAATGKLLHSLPPSSTTPAFDGTTGIVTWQPVWDGPMTVSAVNLTTGHVYWSRTMGSTAGISAVLPPSGSAVIENGLVWLDLMTDTGHPAVLTALRETTGATASRTDSPCSAGTATGPIGIAQHRILADAGCGLAVYRAR